MDTTSPPDRMQPIPFTHDSPIAQFEIGSLQNFIYLVLDWDSRHAAIVDPQKDLTLPLQALRKEGFILDWIFLTHTHFDHVGGVPELLRRVPAVRLAVHQQELHRLPAAAQAHTGLQLLKDGQTIEIGKTRVKVLHTPGHSAGECCYFVEARPPYLLTGDTIFIRDCGRTDLATGSSGEMFESIQRIKKLPAETVILPGHHYAPDYWSTVGIESIESPPFRCKDFRELEALP